MLKYIKYFIFVITQKLDDRAFTVIIFFMNCFRHGKKPYLINFKNPRTFNEKINFIKFNIRNELSPIVADKLKVREFVCEKIGENYLIPLVSSKIEFTDEYWKKLPQQFVLKLNNGSGYNWIIKEKDEFSWKKFMHTSNILKNKNFYNTSREWHYSKIENSFFIEKFIGDSIVDYKFFCSKTLGPFLIQVDTDRFNKHKRNLFDLNWNEQNIEYVYKRSKEKIRKPEKLNEMISICSKLSNDFLFCRIDLYEVHGKVYFGEITIHPEGGLGPFGNFEMDLKIGQMLGDI